MDFDTGMYEPLYWSFYTSPSVLPRVRARGFMALFLAATILWALVWLLYRAWQVCQTPNDVLVDKLGLDIPPAPEITLEEISAREIHIAWKQPELQNSIHKYIVQINSAKVGETKRTETAVAIKNLIPGHIYHICVFAVSAANFQTASAVLHVRTKALPLSQTQQDGTAPGPTIQASASRSTTVITTPSAPIMAREQSGGQTQNKRESRGRKLSPVSSGPDMHHIPVDDIQRILSSEESTESLDQLAERLKVLQQENENTDKQIAEEDEDHGAVLKGLEKQRDQLKQRVKIKDEASGDLKKHVSKLESVNRNVQSEKTKRERLLQQKEAEKKKRKGDIMRWKKQIAQIGKDINRAQEDKSRIKEDSAKQAGDIREKIMGEQAEMKAIDEEIQEKGGRIKKLEEERRRLEGGENEDGNSELDRIDIERARQWEIRFGNLQTRYATLVNLHSQAHQQYQEAQERLKWLNAQRTNGTGPFAGLQPFELDPSPIAAMRRPRHRTSLNSSLSSMPFPLIDSSFNRPLSFNPPSNNSPTFAPSTAFFNITNGMTFAADRTAIPPGESDIAFGNGPMSPRADELLPSNLLGDEESSDLPAVSTSFSVSPAAAPVDPVPHRTPSPTLSENQKSTPFPPAQENVSPLNDIAGQVSQTAVDNLIPTESSNDNQSGPRLLSGLFNFHRQRGKTLADGPLLGSLKPGQSRSFPRNLDDGLDLIGARRRRLSYTGNWAHPISLHRSSTVSVTADSSSDHIPSKRSAFASIFSSSRFNSSGSGELPRSGLAESQTGYNQFSPRHDPIDPSILGTVRRGSSPRPSSTFSFDNHLPHPSTEPFGWPSGEGAGPRNSLGFDWAGPAAWSRSASRRPSIQYGSSTHLPMGLAPEADFLQTAVDTKHRPLQAPIGTRPVSAHRPATPKLNPAAPSFKTLFTKKSEKDKDSINSKSYDHESTADESSPPASRQSRDSRSISTAAESHDSLDLVSSGTPSDGANTKESFIQKITRKSSSSKFNLSWKDRSGLFSKKNDAFQGEVEEDGSNFDGLLGKTVDSSVPSTPSTEKPAKSSRNFFTRKQKRSDRNTSEASENGDEEIAED